MEANDPVELAQMFWDRTERGQLFARDTRAGSNEMVYMEQGASTVHRVDARAGHLICPVPDCPDPAFTTVGGTRRHHFRHLRSGAVAHDGESLAHQTAKHLIGRWAQQIHPDARVEVDSERVANGQLPDVLVELADGARYAFEIQYSALPIETWQKRHDGYVAQGIHDVWILGHLPPHLRRSRRDGSAGDPQLALLHKAIHSAGMPLLWIHPYKELIGAGLLSLCDGEWLEERDPSGFWGRVVLDVAPLGDCRLFDGQMRTPVLTVHLEKVARERAARDRERWREAERERRLVEAARTRAEEADKKRVWRESQASRTLAEWQQYRGDVVAKRFGGEIPEFLTDRLPSEQLVWKHHPNYWRARIYLDHVEGKVGTTFTFADASRELAASQTTASRMPFPFVSDFLRRLQRLGYVMLESGSETFVSGSVTVVADSMTPPPESSTPDPAPDTERSGAVEQIVAVHAGPAREQPRPVDPNVLPAALHALLGVAGRRAWELEKVRYIRRPELRRVPDLLFDQGPNCNAFGVYPPLWHHIVFSTCVDGRIGSYVDDCEALVALGFRHRPEARLVAAATWFLLHLEHNALVMRDGDGFRVVASL